MKLTKDPETDNNHFHIDLAMQGKHFCVGLCSFLVLLLNADDKIRLD